MGNMKIRLLTVVLFFACIFLGSFSEHQIAPSWGGTPPNSPYTGSGATLDVFEFARNDSSIFTDGVNDTAFQYEAGWFPSGYGGYQLVTSVSNLVRTEDIIPNGDFDKYNEAFYINGSEIGLEVHNWTLTRNDGKDDDDNFRIISNIENTTGGTPGDCMDITLRYGKTELVTAIAYLESEFNYFSAITPSNIVFSFDIKFSSDITQQDWLNVSVSLEYQASIIAHWQQTTDIYHPISWDHHSMTTTPINGTVTLRITVMKQFGNKKSDVNGHIYFDNFQYIIESPSKPSEVSLKLDGKDFSDSGGQTGKVTIFADPANQDELPLVNCWTDALVFQFNSSYNISYDYSYSMYIKHQSSTFATTSFSAPVDANPTWEINYSIPLDQPPTGYVGYFFGIYLEPLWSLIQVKNDTGHVISTYSYNASSRFVKLDEGIAQSGHDFSIVASSLNYILQVYLQKSATGAGEWINVTSGDYFIAGDWIRVKALLRSIGPSGNSANVSLFYANQSLWHSDASPIFHDQNDTLTSSSWQVPSIQETDAGSAWLATVAYHNATQSGMRQSSFAVVIPSRGTEISPVEQQRVISGATVLVNVTWQNNESLEFIPDGSARVRYVDRNLQVQYEPMIANGYGGYSLLFDTDSMSPSQTAEIFVELFRYGYVNVTYDDGTHLSFAINLVNDLDFIMIKPTQLTGPNEYTAETARDQGYTSQVRFYDTYLHAYVRNDSGIWKDNLRVNYTYYEDPTGGTSWTLIGTGNFIPDIIDPTIFIRIDSSYGDVEAIKYVVTMHVVGSYDWEYEWQNFTIVIKIVSFATNLDAVQTQIDYPPSGTGDGWTQYENDTDLYIAHVYWNELFNITVRYINESTSNGISGATVQILIGSGVTSLIETSNGYYYYTLNTCTLVLGQTDLYINATQTLHAAQTIKIRIIVELRATQLTKDYPRTTAEIPYEDDFVVLFNFTDVVTGAPAFITDATIIINGYEPGKYTVQNYLNGTYAIIFWGNITEITYYVTVYFSRTNYTIQNQYFEITIRSINTYAIGSAMSGSVPWGENVTIILLFNDTDHDYTGIDNASIIFSWFDDIKDLDYWILNNGNGVYTIILNTSKVASGTKNFLITFVFTKPHYETAQVPISFQVRDRLTALYITSVDPGTSVPWGDTLIVTLTFNDTDDSFNSIAGASLVCDWDVFYWSYIYNPITGAYTLTIRTESRLEGSYTLHIYASKAHYQTFMTLQSFVSRSIQTNYQIDPSFIPSQPWGDNLTIRVHYLDLDHGGYIPFADVETNWNESYYTISWLGNGTYLLELNTTCRDVGSNIIQITLRQNHYVTQIISIDLILRNILTDIIVDPAYIWSHPWGDNVTICIEYLDQDHTDFVLNAIITVDWNVSFYTIYDLGNGTYLIELNTTCRTIGTYVIEIILNRLHYVSQLIEVDLTLRNIQTGYSVNPAYIPSNPWGENVSIKINYVDFDHGTYISGALLIVNWNISYYTIYDLGNGTYIVELNTTCRDVGTYTVLMTLNQLHYESQQVSVQFTLRGRNTQVSYTPPQPIPYLQNLTFTIFYNDSETTAAIHNSTGNVHILLSCTSHPALSLNYAITMINDGNDGYLIIIRTDNFLQVNVWYRFLINITWSSIAPYYQNHSVPISGYVRSIQTTLQLDFNSFVYWGDILYLNATYRDIDNDIVLYGGSVSVWLSWASWSILQIYPDGTYLLQINSSAEDIGLANFTLRFSASFYDTSEQRVQFTINPLPLYVEVLSTSPWIAEYQTTVNISVQVTDEYGHLMNNTPVIYYWAGHNPQNLAFLGNGIYNISFLANQSVGTYLVTIEASNLPNYQTSIGIVILNILPINSVLTVEGPASPVVAGDSFPISANFSTIYSAALPNATVYFNWAGGNGTLSYISGFTFTVTINSSGLDAGQYTIYITASHPNVIEQLRTLSVSLIVMPAYLEADTPVIVVEWGDNFTVLVEFYDYILQPIIGANIQYLWGHLTGSLQSAGIPGWYNITLPSNIFAVGVYQLIITCDHEGYQFAMTSIGLNIQPRQTILIIDEVFTELEDTGIIIPLNGTAWDVPRGDILWIYLNFTDYTGVEILNATGSYTWELGSGVLQFINGFYLTRINLTDVTPGLYRITISLTRQNYETANAPYLQLNVIPVPTEISGLPETITTFTGETFTLNVTFTDTYHNIGITDATLLVTIYSLGLDRRPMVNNGDGTYTLAALSALSEGISPIIIESSAAPKYANTQSSATLIVSLNPLARTAIQGGAIAGVVLVITLLLWLVYIRVYSIPWIVRKMRKMSKSIDRGHTPSLSKGEINRIQERDYQLVTMMMPSYEASSLDIQPHVIPIAELPAERSSEDDVILVELKQLEGLGEQQKEQLFEQMKKIPAKDRVWFMEDMKRQMAEGRFDYLKTGDAKVEDEAVMEATGEKPRLSPVEQATLVAVLREGLEQFSVISDADKDALVQQLIIMTPEEREATIKKLMARMKGLQLEEPDHKPKLEKRKKKVGFGSST